MTLKHNVMIMALLSSGLTLACSVQRGGGDDFTPAESVEPQVSKVQDSHQAGNPMEPNDPRVGRFDGVRMESTLNADGSLLDQRQSSEPRATVVVHTTETETTIRAGFSPENLELVKEELAMKALKEEGAP